MPDTINGYWCHDPKASLGSQSLGAVAGENAPFSFAQKFGATPIPEGHVVVFVFGPKNSPALFQVVCTVNIDNSISGSIVGATTAQYNGVGEFQIWDTTALEVLAFGDFEFDGNLLSMPGGIPSGWISAVTINDADHLIFTTSANVEIDAGELPSGGGGGGGAVNSVNGKTGTVILAAADVGADASGAAAAAQAASQPLDSDLTAIAALTTTTFGRALLTLANAAAGQTAFGLGTAATHAATDFVATSGGTMTGPLVGTTLSMDGGDFRVIHGGIVVDAFFATGDMITLSGQLGNTSGSLLLDADTGSLTALALSVASVNGLMFTGGTGTLTLNSFTATATKSGTIAMTSDTALLAPLLSPALAGVPTAPTASISDNSTTLATTAFVQSIATNAVAGLLKFKGATDCSANPNYPAAVVGDSYIVSVVGKIGGASGTAVDVGDWYICLTANAGGTEASVGTDWGHLEHNLVGALLTSNALSELAGVAGTARSNLGGTTVGQNVFTLSNPSAVTFLRVNADNSISVRTPAQMLSDIGAFAAAGGTVSGSISATGNIQASNLVATGTLNANSVTGATGSFSSAVTGTSFVGAVAAASATGATLASGVTASSLILFGTNPTLSQPNIVGVTNGSSANAGSVGELISSSVVSGSAVSLASGTAKNLTQITLSAGEWDVQALSYILPAAGTSLVFGAISVSQTSATMDFTPGSFGEQAYVSTGTNIGGQNFNVQAGPVRLRPTASATISAVCLCNFSGSTCGVYGILRATRVR